MPEREPHRPRVDFISEKDKYFRDLVSAGFSTNEIDATKHTHLISRFDFQGTRSRDHFLSNTALKFLSASLEQPNQRSLFLKTVFNVDLTSDDLRDSVDKCLQKGRLDKKLLDDFSTYIQYVFNPEKEVPQYQGSMLLFGSEVIQTDFLYKIFNYKITNLLSFSSQHQNLGFRSDCNYLGKVAHQITNSKYGYRLIDGTGSRLLRLAKIPDLYTVCKDEKLTNLFVEFLDTEETWADKLSFTNKAIKILKTPYIRREDLEEYLLQKQVKEVAKTSKLSEREFLDGARKMGPSKREGLTVSIVQGISKFRRSDKYVNDNIEGIDYKKDLFSQTEIARVKRRESVWHPLVSLGIAKTVGYEIEFPLLQSRSLVDLEKMFVRLGFKKGDGGHGYTETSPGPFHDPETANLVFGAYVDSGMIDFYDVGPMSMHFNVGIEPKWQGEVAKLIRAMHLTGAGVNPNRKFEGNHLKIYPNVADGITYTECKTFDVVTRREFEWNMEATSYLSWALGQNNDLDFGDNSNWEIRSGLARVWRYYITTINSGLVRSVVSRGTYLQDGIKNDSYAVQEIMEQLKFIFDIPMARYGELKNIDSSINKRILPVVWGEQKWGNLASFAREITDNAVAGIKRLTNELEKEATDEVKRIEQMTGFTRANAIIAFLAKYNYEPTIKNQRLSNFEAFSQIKKCLLDEV